MLPTILLLVKRMVTVSAAETHARKSHAPAGCEALTMPMTTTLPSTAPVTVMVRSVVACGAVSAKSSVAVAVRTLEMAAPPEPIVTPEDEMRMRSAAVRAVVPVVPAVGVERIITLVPVPVELPLAMVRSAPLRSVPVMPSAALKV